MKRTWVYGRHNTIRVCWDGMIGVVFYFYSSVGAFW